MSAPETCPETAALFEKFCAEREAQAATEVKRLVFTARKLARSVGAYAMTVDDAETQLERKVRACSAIPYRIACGVAQQAFGDELAARGSP